VTARRLCGTSRMKDSAVYTPLKAWYAYAPEFITKKVVFQVRRANSTSLVAKKSIKSGAVTGGKGQVQARSNSLERKRI
jgi:hypothetical protein